ARPEVYKGLRHRSKELSAQAGSHAGAGVGRAAPLTPSVTTLPSGYNGDSWEGRADPLAWGEGSGGGTPSPPPPPQPRQRKMRTPCHLTTAPPAARPSPIPSCLAQAVLSTVCIATSWTTVTGAPATTRFRKATFFRRSTRRAPPIRWHGLSSSG